MERDAAFRRAIPLLEAAVRNANSSGQSDVATAAQGGLAQVYLGLGDMQNAVANAAKVPTDFVFAAAYSSNSGRETSQIWNETHGRHEISAWMTLAGTVGAGDPRTPWTDCSDPSSGCPSGNGADGQTIHYRQEKYPTRDDDIPLVKGTEMRLIEAEAALMALVTSRPRWPRSTRCARTMAWIRSSPTAPSGRSPAETAEAPT